MPRRRRSRSSTTSTFTLTLTNAGPDPVENVVVDDLLTSGFIFQGATASIGSYGQGLWTIPSLPVGTATLDIDATVAQGGSQTNLAELISVVGLRPRLISGQR